MIIYPSIDPVALQFGPFKIYWYGIMYILGFATAWILALYKARSLTRQIILVDDVFVPTMQQISDLIFYAAIGVIIGGRCGFILFSEFKNFLHNPLILFQVWNGGMSFHGGLIGVGVSLCFFARKTKASLLSISDFVAPLVPIGLMLGRIGNFINSELWGQVTALPWGIVYPNAGPLPRHPSQIYEALTEGVLLFIILWFYSARPKPKGSITAIFLLGYGTIRFCCEFFRFPDPAPAFISFGWMTMGQVLSVPMIITGALLLWYSLVHSHGNTH